MPTKIKWRNEMTVDEGIIDADHKVLIEIFNQFVEAQRKGLSLPSVQKTVHKLRRYTEMHFVREERLQELIDFGLRFSHKREHESIEQALDEFEARLLEAGEEELSHVTGQVLDFFSAWLVDHVLISDIKMRDRVHEIRKKQRSMKSLDELVKEAQAKKIA